MKIPSIILYCAALLIFSVAHSMAASSDWQDLGGGKARLLASLDPATGELNAAVEVKLEPGWSTYWRYPGSSGIPPMFDFSPTPGFELSAIDFPSPQLLGSKSNRYAGYKKTVTFPISGRFVDGITPKVHLKILMGVCREVCIPAQAELKITTAQLMQSDPIAQQAIRLARLSIPRHADPGNVVMKTEEGAERNLVVTVNSKSDDTRPSLFVEGPAEWYLQPAELLSQEDGYAVFSLDLSRAPASVDITEHPLKFTLVNGNSAIEFLR